MSLSASRWTKGLGFWATPTILSLPDDVGVKKAAGRPLPTGAHLTRQEVDLQHSVVLLVKPHELYPRGTISRRLRKTSGSWTAVPPNPRGGLWPGEQGGHPDKHLCTHVRGTGVGVESSGQAGRTQSVI